MRGKNLTTVTKPVIFIAAGVILLGYRLFLLWLYQYQPLEVENGQNTYRISTCT
jgi:hypothetical protein